jgi:hypothetical protein
MGASSILATQGSTAPCEASDALRAIERYAVLWSVQLDKIRRQDLSQAKKAEGGECIATYRKAVEASAGDLIGSLEHLESLGALKECGIDEHRERLTEAYLGFAARRQTAIVVSQTRADVRPINEAVRAWFAPLRSSYRGGDERDGVRANRPDSCAEGGCSPLSR